MSAKEFGALNKQGAKSKGYTPASVRYKVEVKGEGQVEVIIEGTPVEQSSYQQDKPAADVTSPTAGSEWNSYKTIFQLGNEDLFEQHDEEHFRPCSTLPLARDDEDAASVNEPIQRGNWSGKFDFLLSLVGYSVGLGTVWRFPYMVYTNGGGAFLIPFVVMLFLVGFPLMFMELAFGQYASLGPIAIFERICPLFHGLGYGMVMVSSLVAVYYNMIIAWTLFYLFASWTQELPWERCQNAWSSPDCYSYKDVDSCKAKNNSVYFNKTCYNATAAQELNIVYLDASKRRSPAEEYFENYVLSMSRGMEDMGGVKWQLALCLLAAWVIAFLCLSKGVQSSGKVVYFTALFPYVVLIILFFRGITLPGAKEGIIFYVKPDFSRLSKAKVWCDAAVQIFFSLSPAFGGLITLASYNKFHNNCFRDSLIVSLSNIATSIFAGFVIFSIVGYMAREMNKSVSDVVDQGAGLAFIVFPEVVTRLPVSPLWSTLFFFMLLTLGLDTQFALLETITTAILDRFPMLREKKTWVVLLISVTGFVGGLAICTRGGFYVLQLLDYYAVTWSLFVLALLELVIITYVYGSHRFSRDIEMMIGARGVCWHRFLCVFWKFLTPLTLLFLLIFNWIQYKPMQIKDYVYPLWANLIGWFIAFAPVVTVPMVMISKICSAPQKLTFMQRLRYLTKPMTSWGPAHKIASVSEEYTQSHVMTQIHSLAEVKSQGSFENPSFNMVYTFENHSN